MKIPKYPDGFYRFTNPIPSDDEINTLIKEGINKMITNDWHEYSISKGNLLVIIDKIEGDDDNPYEISVTTGHARAFCEYED